MTMPFRSLSSLALSSSALRNLPGRYDDAASPGRRAGARFTWQSKTFMKIETRRAGLLAEAELDAAATTSATAATRPSAGLTIEVGIDRRDPLGIAEEIDAPPVSARPSQPIGCQSQNEEQRDEDKARR